MLRSSILTLCVALSPIPALAESTLAIAGAVNGLYMSRDRGYTWEKNAALGEVAVRAVAIDRSDLKRLYVATSEALLVSGDGGVTWSAGVFPQPAKVQRLRPAGQGVVFALADDSVWSNSDGARHWRAELGIPTGIVDLAVGAGAPPAVYALTAEGLYTKSGGSAWMGVGGLSGGDAITADPVVPGTLFRLRSGRFGHSTDGGVTWTDLPEVPAQEEAKALGWYGNLEAEITLTAAALAPGQHEAAVIAFGTGMVAWDGYPLGPFSGIVVAENRNWRNAQLSDLVRPAALAVDRASNLALAGGLPNRGSGLYRSNAAGARWTAVGAFTGISVSSLAIATVDVEPWSQVYTGTNKGLFSSIDGGETWHANAGLGKAEVFAVGVDQGGSGLLLASTADGLFRSADAGASWEKSELPAEIQASAIAIDPKPEGRAYLVQRNARGAQRLRLWTSEDHGRSWYQVASQPEGIRDVTLDPRTTPATVYVAGAVGVYKSTDEALTWTSIYRGGAQLVRVGGPAGTIYLDGEDGVWKTENGGESWQLMGPPIRSVAPNPPGQPLYEWVFLEALAIGSGRNEGLIAGCVTLIAGYGPGFPPSVVEAASLFSFDGDRWHTSPVSAAWWEGAVDAVEIDPRAAGLVYAGGLGLWRSSDSGRSWSAMPAFEGLVVYAISTGPTALRTGPVF